MDEYRYAAAILISLAVFSTIFVISVIINKLSK